MLPYACLSQFYDKLIIDDEYDAWTNYVVSLVKKYSCKSYGVDCACGSGIVTAKLKKAGFSVTGVDISEEMLVKAEERALNEKLKISFLRQDMKNLKLFEKTGFITVVNDGLNYLPQSDLPKAFKSFYKNLEKNGVLIFDVSSEYKLKNVLANNVYCDDDENLSYVWFNALKDGYVELSITFFEKQGEFYKRSEENQIQYIHSLSDIKAALNASGFNLISVTDEKGGEITDETQRLLFVVVKN